MSHRKDAPPEDNRHSHAPDFELSHQSVIREDNWQEWAAKGFYVTMARVEDHDLTEEINLAQAVYGVENVYSGDAWSYKEGRPLRHFPGTGIYVAPEGRAKLTEWRAKHFPNERRDTGQP